MTYKYPSPISPYSMRCYCIELPDAPEYHWAFVDLLMTMTRWWIWERDKAHQGAQAAAYLSTVLLPQLENNFMCCCDQTNVILQLQLQQLFIIWNSAVTNTDINIYAPVTTFETTSGETTSEYQGRVNALCYALQAMIDTMCEAAIQILESQINQANLLAAVAVIVSLTAGLLTGGAATAFGFGIASALLYGIGSLAGLVTKPQLENTAARSELACAVRDAIKDLAPTEANLWSAIDGITGLSTDGMALLSVLKSLHVRAQDSKQIFEAFINALGEGQQLGMAGLLPACECCPTVDYTYDYHSGDWTSTAPFEAVNEADPLPVTFDPPAAVHGWRFELVGFDGHLAFAGGSNTVADIIGLTWTVPDEQLGCTLASIELGVYDPNYALARLFVDRGFGWEHIGDLGLFDTYSIKTLTLGISHVQRIGVAVDSSYTASPECRLAYLRFNFS